MDTNANTTIAARCSVYGRGWASAGSISQTLTPGAVSSDAFWRASIPPGRCRVGVSRRELRALRGFVFDLDGCVWTGDVLVRGAAEVLALLRERGRGGSFLTNNSAARSATMQAKLERLGVQAALPEVLTPLEILGEVIDARWGASRGLVIGAELLGSTLAESGHTLVPMDRFREAQVVVVGRDPGFTYDRLTAAARAIDGGAHFLPPTLDPRLPLEDGAPL